MDEKQYPFATYGTLKTGMGNHRVIAIAVTRSRMGTLTGYEMRVVGNGSFPFIRALPGDEGTVTVEVFDLDPERYPYIMRNLDMLEGYVEERDDNHYNRELLEITLDDGAKIMAWVYTGDHVGPKESHYSRQVRGNKRAGDLYPVIADGVWTPDAAHLAWKAHMALPNAYQAFDDLYDADDEGDEDDLTDEQAALVDDEAQEAAIETPYQYAPLDTSIIHYPGTDGKLVSMPGAEYNERKANGTLPLALDLAKDY